MPKHSPAPKINSATGRTKFPFDSDQLELLLAFEKAPGLDQLAKLMCRDTSVVSRNLSRLGACGRVLSKSKRKWALTQTGKKLNQLTEAYLAEAAKLLKSAVSETEALSLGQNACLVIINAQTALQSPSLGHSSNAAAAKHIDQILGAWRHAGLPIVHAPHVSLRPESMFHRNKPGFAFMPGLEPRVDEIVSEKQHPNAFFETNLAHALDRIGAATLVIVGFTAHECIDASAKQAIAMGFDVLVIDDAIAQFEITGPSGKVFSAADVHEIVMSGLSQVARVASTRDLLQVFP